MLYDANIPLENASTAHLDRFKAGLLSSARAGYRRHFPYDAKGRKDVLRFSYRKLRILGLTITTGEGQSDEGVGSAS